jgi:hypothetical protein
MVMPDQLVMRYVPLLPSTSQTSHPENRVRAAPTLMRKFRYGQRIRAPDHPLLVDNREPGKGFQPRRLLSATSKLGTYEIFETGKMFECWFTKKSNGAFVILGKAENVNAARDKCERHAKGAC